MKKTLALLLSLLLLALPLCALGETVATSFYPIYLFALNLTQGIDGLEVRNLAAPGTGCLHDYQLQTGDMKALAEADVFLVNGAGMEELPAKRDGRLPGAAGGGRLRGHSPAGGGRPAPRP